MQKGLALSIDRTSLPRVRTAARLVARILPLAGLAAALAACGLAQGSGGGGQVTVQAVEKTATVSGVTRSCVAWRSDAALVKQNGGPLSKTLPTEVKTLEEEFPGWWREATLIRAIDKSVKRRKAAIKAMDRAPKEPNAAYAAIRRDLRTGLALRLKGLQTARKAHVQRRDALLLDAIRQDYDGIKRYEKGVTAMQTLSSLLQAQCPGGDW
jgi:hypothetical protein